MSPGTFYAGVSPSPPATNAFDDDKENQDPSLQPDNVPSAAETETETAATSKHFGGAGGEKAPAPAPAPSGLRKRFRPPLAGARSAAGSAPRRGRGGDDVGGGQNGDRDSDPWGEGFAYPRLGIDGDAGTAAMGVVTGGRTGNTDGGSTRLKRRRTLGLGSLAPKGLIRGLDGVASSGTARGLGAAGGGPGRRSKSLGGERLFFFACYFLLVRLLAHTGFVGACVLKGCALCEMTCSVPIGTGVCRTG